MKAELDEICRESRLGRGDAEVGRDSEPESGADGCALDRRDDRLAGGEQTQRLVVKFSDGIGAPRADAVRRYEIGAGTERLTFRSKNDRAALGLGIKSVE